MIVENANPVEAADPVAVFKGEVDYDRIDEDVRRLTDYYRGLGFFRARVGREWCSTKSRTG